MGNNVNTKLITAYIKKNNLTETEFCNNCRITKADLDLIFAGSLDFDLIILFKIARLLNLKVCELFIDFKTTK